VDRAGGMAHTKDDAKVAHEGFEAFFLTETNDEGSRGGDHQGFAQAKDHGNQGKEIKTFFRLEWSQRSRRTEA